MMVNMINQRCCLLSHVRLLHTPILVAGDSLLLFSSSPVSEAGGGYRPQSLCQLRMSRSCQSPLLLIVFIINFRPSTFTASLQIDLSKSPSASLKKVKALLHSVVVGGPISQSIPILEITRQTLPMTSCSAF